MPTGRLHAALRALPLTRRVHACRRAEAAALAVLGAAVGRALAADPAPPLLTRVVEAARRVATLEQGEAQSLVQDRTDYGSVAGWMQPVVIARGLAARAVLRHQRRRAVRDLVAARQDLGRAAVADAADIPVDAVPQADMEAVVAARRALGEALARQAENLAPLGGSLLPRGAVLAAAEAVAFGQAVWGQLRAHLLPRTPALAGMLAGWWVAQTYTDSHWRATLTRFGLADGGTRVVSPETYARLRFWLPLLAAAACAYAGSRLATLVRRRYGADQAA